MKADALRETTKEEHHMWRRMCAALSALALAFALAGCGSMNQNGAAGSDSENNLGSLFAQNNGQKEEKEPEKVTLTYSVEGEEETAEAEVYTGTGYTIAIPTDWVRANYAVRWNPANNDAVSLAVRYYDAEGKEAAAEAFCRENTDYAVNMGTVLGTVSETLSGALGVRGTDEAGNVLSAFFIDATEVDSKNKDQAEIKGCYALVLKWPKEATEGYASGLLPAVVNSFAFTAEESAAAK